ncbi:MAG: hypothetical protein M3Q65_12205 [Chloroflexota bacterium]|nr:hypothetical protein [Chloroflexota bacterium]
MQRPISTRLHGILDYVSVPTLLALPRVLGWSPTVTGLLTGSALGTLGASLMTKYELGLVKLLPVPGHLALDGMTGGLLAAAPFLLLDENDKKGNVTPILLGLGLFEIGAALLTKTKPSFQEQASQLGDQLEDRVRQAADRGQSVGA